MMKRTLVSALILTLISFYGWSEIFFSGFAGAKIDYLTDKTEDDDYEPDMKFQSFFAGQFNISENVIAHTEFSLGTGNIIDHSLFKETSATFQIDELSLIFRKPLLSATNYFSLFVGTYEPIGSDIFLRRQFGIQPVSSMLTESWLGLAGSIIYPLFGAGCSDIIHFDSRPVATGFYLYVNHEKEDSYVLNGDYRFACVYRFFTLDVAAGVGFPLVKDERDDAFFVVDRFYGRAGLNMLIGNSYTNSVFLQAGISDVPITKESEAIEYDEDDFYFLLEPRFRGKKYSADFTMFSLPDETVEKFILIEDTLGMNLNIFTDDLYIRNKMIIFGINTTLSFPEKNYSDLKDIPDLFKDYEVSCAPYVKARFFNGELNAMFKANVSEMIEETWYKGIKLSLGYKSQF